MSIFSKANKNSTKKEFKRIILETMTKEERRKITYEDLVNDSKARGDKEAYDILKAWDSNRDGYENIAFMELRHDYLVEFCGLEETDHDKRKRLLEESDEYFANQQD